MKPINAVWILSIKQKCQRFIESKAAAWSWALKLHMDKDALKDFYYGISFSFLIGSNVSLWRRTTVFKTRAFDQ